MRIALGEPGFQRGSEYNRPGKGSNAPGRQHLTALPLAFGLFAIVSAPALAQAPAELALQTDLSARKIFFMLFLMLGPIKILVPFVNMTRACEPAARRQIARRAIMFSAAALVLAGLLGQNMLDNFAISLPVLAVTGGVILFLVALQTVIQPAGAVTIATKDDEPPSLKMAVTPLAFPTIVTPYGVAAVIIFATLAADRPETEMVVVGIVMLILALDWVAMLFADMILRWFGTLLQVLAVVLGVTQVALGLQVILHNLSIIGVFAERTN
jgi:multiple antibiotic resistance protein